MHPKNKAAMEIALKQTNIAEACTKYVSNIFAFSRTCKEYFNVTKKFRIRQVEKINDHDELSLYGSTVCYTNTFLSEIKRVSSENEFRELLEQVPSYHWLSLTKLELYLGLENEYNYEKENYMESILAICFQKATNLEKMTLSSYENIANNHIILLKLLGGFKSDSLKTINFSLSFFTYSATTCFEKASSFKSLLKENFPNFEHIHVDVFVDGYNKRLLKKLASLFKSSLSSELDIFIFNMHFSSSKGMLDFNDIFSDIHSSQIKFVFSGLELNANCDKQFMDTPHAEQLIQNIHFNNFMYLHKGMEIIHDLEIYDKIKSMHFISSNFEHLTDESFQFVTASLKHLSNLKDVNISSYLVLENDIQKVKTFMLSFPTTIEGLKLTESDFDMMDMGRKLAESYPNLKKLNITFSEKFDFDPSYFMAFQNIGIIKMDCVGKFLPFLLCLNYLYAAQDSDGTYFVTSFPWFSEPNPNNIGITLNFFNNAAQKNIVTISYWFVATKIKETQTVALDANAVGSTNLFFRDVVKDFLDFSKEHSLIPDPRIIISSQYSIKVISRIFNQATGLGDAEMIPSSAIAQLNYLVQLPPANPGATQIIHILGSDTTDATVNVYHFIDGTYYQTYILNVKKEFGSYQNVITTFAADPKRRHAFSIYSDKAIYVIGAVSHINLLSTSVTNDPATADSITDYGMMHFYPLHYFDCTYSFFLGSEDRRMLTSDYTKSVYVTPPRNNACIDQLPINVFRQVTGNKPSIVHLQNFVASTMTLTPNNQGGTSSLLSYTPWIRFGGLRGTTADTLDQLFSAFLHYVPETSQFVTGSVNLATFSPNSIIEVYADSTVTSTSFYLDGLFVDGTMFKSSSKIAFFDGKYNVFTILVKNAGFHVLRVAGTGTYVAYVMGDNVKDLTGSYGYVAGYNINKLAVYNTGPGTQKPPVTTTKGSSMAERSLLTILFASILLNV